MAKLQIHIIMFSLFVSSCTRIPHGSEKYVANLVQKRIGKDVYWNCEDSQINCYIQNLILHPISIESAVQIGLLHNPNIQALFEEIGIAEADLVEAGLLSNPAFEIEVRYPHTKKLKTNIEYLIATTFLDIFLIPLRTKLAATELEQTKLKVSNEILDLAFDIRETYYKLAAENQILHYTQTIAELANIQNTIAQRQYDVGNIYQLDLEKYHALFLEADLQIIQSQEEIIRLKEKLHRLLGFGQETPLIFSEQLPQKTDDQAFDLCELEAMALQERIDLQVARCEMMRLRHLLGLKEGWNYTDLNIGVAGERDSDGSNVIGPGFSGKIPIFNYGQAARLRLFAQLRQAQDRLDALEVRILSEVRESHKLLMKNLKMIHTYLFRILPLQQSILHSSEKLYNVMGLGIDRLLENKRNEAEIYRNYLISLKDYWISRVQLDRTLGGYLFRLFPQEEFNSKGIE